MPGCIILLTFNDYALELHLNFPSSLGVVKR